MSRMIECRSVGTSRNFPELHIHRLGDYKLVKVGGFHSGKPPPILCSTVRRARSGDASLVLTFFYHFNPASPYSADGFAHRCRSVVLSPRRSPSVPYGSQKPRSRRESTCSRSKTLAWSGLKITALNGQSKPSTRGMRLNSLAPSRQYVIPVVWMVSREALYDELQELRSSYSMRTWTRCSYTFACSFTPAIA